MKSLDQIKKSVVKRHLKLKELGYDIKLGHLYELEAHEKGYDCWNSYAQRLSSPRRFKYFDRFEGFHELLIRSYYRSRQQKMLSIESELELYRGLVVDRDIYPDNLNPNSDDFDTTEVAVIASILCVEDTVIFDWFDHNADMATIVGFLKKMTDQELSRAVIITEALSLGWKSDRDIRELCADLGMQHAFSDHNANPVDYTHHTDSQNGWIAVPLSELIELDLTHRISSRSRQSGDFVYLYEADDTDIWLQAYSKHHGKKPKLRTLKEKKTSFVVSFEKYEV